MPTVSVLILLLFCVSRTALAETRHALIIGVDKYPGNELHNAVNDADAVSDALQTLGYKTLLVSNSDRHTMLGAVDYFVASLQPGDTALLYYAGHGLQVSGENYLVPSDFTVTTPEAVPEQGVSLSSILSKLSDHGASTEIVILDACRDNPFIATRSLKGGWAPLGTSAGMFLAFGTSPGSTASDDPQSPHGLFTGELLPLLAQSNLEIEAMFRELRMRVIQRSAGTQIPWTASSLIGTFHIKPELDQNTTSTIQPIPSRDPGMFSASRSIEDTGGHTQPVKTESLPPEAAAEIEQAMSLVRSSRLADAIGVLQHVLALWPQAGAALKLLGLLLHYVGRDAESIQVFDRAIALKNDQVSADAAAYKCAIESISGSDEATGNCYAAAQVYPTADSQLVLAAALHSRGSYAAAHESILRSVAQRQTELGFAMKGAIEVRLGNTSEAATSYQRAVGMAIGSGRQ